MAPSNCTLKLTVFDPIIIQLGEREYRIESLSSRLLADFQEAANTYGQEPTKINAEAVGMMLAKVLPGMTQAEAMDLDIRHVLRIAEFLAEQISEATQPGKEKNG